MRNPSRKNNELIKKRRKKRLIKRYVILLIFLISVLCTLCLKLPYFNIKDIKVYNNRNVESSEIINLSKITVGGNIFYLNTREIKNGILSNPYIISVDISRKVPSTIEITVKERNAVFYINKGNNFLIIDRSGIALEEKNDIKTMNLIKLDGFDASKAEVGKKLTAEDSRKFKVIEDVTDVVMKSNKNLPQITEVSIEDILDIKIFYGQMCVKLGDGSNFYEKLNKAVNILKSDEYKSAKGYIDVSYNSNPVILIEK